MTVEMSGCMKGKNKGVSYHPTATNNDVGLGPKRDSMHEQNVKVMKYSLHE